MPKTTWVYDGNPNQVERYFLDRSAVRVQTHQVAASNDNRSSVKQTEFTYAVMMKISTGLGVSCSECHNSRAFNSWEQAPPQRVQALHGAEMVRHINYQYLLPLNAVLPASRLGPMGDSPKALCATCHNGAYKPLYGYAMAKDYPALWGRKDWNGQPFPAIPAAEPVAAPRRRHRPAVSGHRQAAPAAVPAPAVPPAAAPKAAAPSAATPPTSSGAGAMGGRGVTGKTNPEPKP